MIIPVVTGATASGKSGLLYSVYDELGFEYISADAFQVYKGLDIGTAKPSADIQAAIPHHLIDIISFDGSYTAGDFAKQAERAVTEVLSRGKLPIIAGGTGLYIQALTEGIFEVPSDDSIREELRMRLQNEGNTPLYAELAAIDAEYSAKIHENDHVRIIRALEVYKITGMPMSRAHIELRRKPEHEYKIMVLDKNRETLYSDINKRVDEMISAGWAAEVRSLLDNGAAPDMPSFRAIGYKELAAMLSGEISEAEAIAAIAQKTRNYAKRQLTWFRGMKNANFMSETAIKTELLKWR